jgi:TonB family protein
MRMLLLLTLYLWPLAHGAESALLAFPRKLPAASSPQNSPVQQEAFQPPAVLSASDAHYPLQTAADGIVVFNVSLNARGDVTAIDLLNDVPPLTGSAQSSLRSWKFTPASLNGVPESSQMLIAFVFRPAVKVWSPPLFTPVFPPKEQAGYIPPGIFTASYADYPAAPFAAGDAVVQVSVQAGGQMGSVKVLRSASGGFARLAVEAARKWEFQPAVLDGTPVTSNVAIAFVFSSRAPRPF